MATFEKYVAVFRVTARKDGAVFRTEFVEHRWVDGDTPHSEGDIIYAPVSTTVEQQMIKEGKNTLRRKRNG